MIQPVTSTNPISNTTPQSQPQTYKNKAKEKEENMANIEWYCNSCHNYFKVPDPIKYKFHPIKGQLFECKVLNCPFCGEENIINNRDYQGEGKLWTSI